MSNIDYVVNLCFELSEQGKIPSVALIRSRAQHPLAIPEVIKGVQRWKSHPGLRPKTHHKKVNTRSTASQSLQERVSQLEVQLTTIMQELDRIKDQKNR
jgi:hypothetical protein|tara:strand:+ start:274 stop:570 length:297 start_codon:yes stop_codon:yes gene_type:complete